MRRGSWRRPRRWPRGGWFRCCGRHHIGERVDSVDLAGDQPVGVRPGPQAGCRHVHGTFPGGMVAVSSVAKVSPVSPSPALARVPWGMSTGPAQRFRRAEPQHGAGTGLAGQPGRIHQRADEVLMRPPGMGQILLVPGFVDEGRQQADDVGVGLEEQPHRVAGIDGLARGFLVGGDDHLLDAGGRQFRKIHGGEVVKQAHNVTPSLSLKVTTAGVARRGFQPAKAGCSPPRRGVPFLRWRPSVPQSGARPSPGPGRR